MPFNEFKEYNLWTDIFRLLEESSLSHNFRWTIISGAEGGKQQGSSWEARNAEVFVLIYQWQSYICFCTSIKLSDYTVFKVNEIQKGGFSCFLTKAVAFKGLMASFHAFFFPVDWQQCINTLYLELRFWCGFILGTFVRRPLHNIYVV